MAKKKQAGIWETMKTKNVKKFYYYYAREVLY